MLVVDPNHWLSPTGEIIKTDARLFDRMLRIARFIEYGGPLKRSETRETLVECKRRVKGKRCMGLMKVFKADDGGILAHCPACENYEAYVQNWQGTPWASGVSQAVHSMPPASHRSAF
jgi:hypothetical protein